MYTSRPPADGSCDSPSVFFLFFLSMCRLTTLTPPLPLLSCVARSSLVKVLDANAILVSVVIEALASLAEACGPQCGEAFLRRALYPLLEKVSSFLGEWLKQQSGHMHPHQAMVDIRGLKGPPMLSIHTFEFLGNNGAIRGSMMHGIVLYFPFFVAIVLFRLLTRWIFFSPFWSLPLIFTYGL